MKSIFEVKIKSFENLLEIEGSWLSKNFNEIMDSLDYYDREGLTETDMRDTCLMLLQDLGPEDAAYCVLKNRLGTQLKNGQVKNMSVEMLDEKLWEEYADPELHEELFNVGSLLYSAFPGDFPKPDAVSLVLEIIAKNEAAKVELKKGLNEALALRILADGMDPSAVLLRLYGDQIAGYSAEEADKILWDLKIKESSDTMITSQIVSSGYWLDSLEDVDQFESNGFEGK